MTGSAAAVPMYWKVKALDDQPLNETEIAISLLWQQKRSDFPNPEKWSSLSYDEKALRQFIADTLNIPYSETHIRELDLREYPIVDSSINHVVSD